MIRVDRKLNSIDVIDVLTDMFILRGPPAFIRSDNGPEFVAEAVSNNGLIEEQQGANLDALARRRARRAVGVFERAVGGPPRRTVG